MASDTDTSSSDKISDHDDLSFWKRRHLEFRVLILGRANAGKTTILERLTGSSIDKAKVWRDGELLAGQAIKGQSDRGLHNIDDEICFPSLPGFVFHDSRGFEAGSSEELSTVRQFVEDRSSAAKSLQTQLHAIWMCLPLDDPREFLETEKEFCRWLKGDAPLVVIFTKRDGAVGKVTRCIVDNSSLSDSTVSRAFKKEARAQAEIQVAQRVKEREEELRELSQTNSCIAFLTTSDMQKPTAQSTAACGDLIKATEEGLTGPRVKTLLSVVWGRNLSKSGFWCFYWVLESNHKSGTKLGSKAPDMLYMMERVIAHMMDYDDYYRRRDYYDDDYYDDDHRRDDYYDRHRYDDDHDNEFTMLLTSAFGPIFHMYTPALNDVEVLTLSVCLCCYHLTLPICLSIFTVVMVLMHAVYTEVLSSNMPVVSTWLSAIFHFLQDHHDLVQDKACSLGSQVVAIIGEIEDSNIITKWKSISIWKFSKEKAEMFAGKLSKCVEDNLI